MDEVPIHLHIEPLEDGGFLATSPDVPGLVVDGDTIAEVIETAKVCALAIKESCIANGFPVPPALVRQGPVAALDLIVPLEVR